MLIRWMRQPALVSLALLAGVVSPSGAAKVPDGRVIYRQQCASCHGKTGEGVKDKYADGLHGDWSMEKLTRYIERNMPEEDPDKINGPEVEAVSRYIYEAFYSREARARKNPARIELVHLTNLQYANAVADLLRSFTGGESAFGGERGLRASYQPRGTMRNNRKAIDRVDREVNFNFDQGSPFDDQSTNGPSKTNEFSMSWRGSVFADETGDYDFIVQTPNGVRLWVNNEEQPLIDASVASANVTEHKARLRLIGGRAYPLRLECSKAPRDKKASVALLWKQPHGSEEIIEARSLSTARVAPTFVISTPFPPDDSSVGYARGTAVSRAWDEATTFAAIEVANHIVKNLDRYTGTKTTTNRAAKAQSFCEQFAAAAFRRPLTVEQRKLIVAEQFKIAPLLEDAVKRSVLLSLKSPQFLYLGLDGAKPDDFAVASRLSFALWDSVPDAELTKAATQGALRTPEQVAAQSRRMLADPRARAKMRVFLHQWLQVNHSEDFSKDVKMYPEFTPDLVSDLRTSLNLFIDGVVWSERSDYRELLLADYLPLNNRLAQFYGVATNAADEFVPVKFDPKQRSGVVTHPFLLSAFAYQNNSSPIHRGVFLTRNIVGRALKSPPVAVAFIDTDFPANLSMREKIVELTRPQACQGCHSVINPLGFSLEHYDAVGKFRTRENGKPVNAASEYITDDGTAVKLTGARDVAEFAVKSEHAHSAFVEQLFHNAVKQPMLAYGADVPERLRQAFEKSDFNVQQLLVNIATVSALHGVERPRASLK
jgi:mono/diheme cytochrome c family protein